MSTPGAEMATSGPRTLPDQNAPWRSVADTASTPGIRAGVSTSLSPWLALPAAATTTTSWSSAYFTAAVPSVLDFEPPMGRLRTFPPRGPAAAGRAGGGPAGGRPRPAPPAGRPAPQPQPRPGRVAPNPPRPVERRAPPRGDRLFVPPPVRSGRADRRGTDGYGRAR